MIDRNENAMPIFAFLATGAEVQELLVDGEPWFVLADVCGVLEIANPSQAASRLDEDEKGIISSDTPSGVQQLLGVNESGLYSLVLTSRKPAAKRFKKWVTRDVLPSIRKTGVYVRGEELLKPDAVKALDPIDFYALRNPVAVAFQDWVTRDVLPSIRKTGVYVRGEELLKPGAVSTMDLNDLDALRDQLEMLMGRKAERLD